MLYPVTFQGGTWGAKRRILVLINRYKLEYVLTARGNFICWCFGRSPFTYVGAKERNVWGTVYFLQSQPLEKRQSRTVEETWNVTWAERLSMLEIGRNCTPVNKKTIPHTVSLLSFGCRAPNKVIRCFPWIGDYAISYPEPSNFLRRMLDENEGLWKGPLLKVRK